MHKCPALAASDYVDTQLLQRAHRRSTLSPLPLFQQNSKFAMFVMEFPGGNETMSVNYILACSAVAQVESFPPLKKGRKSRDHVPLTKLNVLWYKKKLENIYISHYPYSKGLHIYISLSV